MKVEMVMPQMGESIAEGTIIKWLKKEGENVAKDENILEISTDKVDSEIPSPAAGKIVALLAGEGDTVPVGQVIAHIETEAAAGAGAAPTPAAGSQGQTPSPVKPAAPEPPAPPAAPAGAPGSEPARAEPAREAARPAAPSPPAPQRPAAPVHPAATQPAAAPAAAIPTRDDGGRFYSPLVRSIAQQEGVSLEELASIGGTGRGGRVSKNDLLAYLERRGPRGAAPAARGAAGPAARPAAATPQIRLPAGEPRVTAEGAVEIVPMDHIRQKIAEHMVRSKATSPHVASITEVDMTKIVRWREARKAEFERREGFKLTYTPVFLQAVVRALKDFPIMNASLEGTNIVLKRYINIGMAVAVDYGLIVPVVKGADTLNFLGLARAVNDLAMRARGRALKPDEVTGGTFSITNMGTVGTLFGVPIIAQPQVGILGIGTIQKRPVVRDDAIAIRDMMYICLSYDHRLIDGATGGAFVQRVADHLENMELE